MDGEFQSKEVIVRFYNFNDFRNTLASVVMSGFFLNIFRPRNQ